MSPGSPDPDPNPYSPDSYASDGWSAVVRGWIGKAEITLACGIAVAIWFANGDPTIVIVASLFAALLAALGLFKDISNKRKAAAWFGVVVVVLVAESTFIIVHARSPIEPPPTSSAVTPPAAPPAAPGTNAPLNKPLTHEQRSEIATKIDILGTSNNFHNDFAGVDKAWADTQSHWVGFVKTDRPGFLSIIGQMREVLGGVSSKMSDLRNEYREYPDIYALFDQPKTGGALKALEDLSDATAALPDPPPPDFDIRLRPFVGTVTTEVEAMMAGLKDFENQSTTLLKQLKVRAQQ